MSGTLSQRDRVLLAGVIRQLIAREIRAQGTAETYDPAVCSISAFDLFCFTESILLDQDGDDVTLAETVTQDIADIAEAHPSLRAASLIYEHMPAPYVLDRLQWAKREDIERRRAEWRGGK